MALELIDALKQLFQCSFIVMHSIIKFAVGEKKELILIFKTVFKMILLHKLYLSLESCHSRHLKGKLNFSQQHVPH